MFQRILYATDGSHDALAAADLLNRLPLAGSELRILTVTSQRDSSGEAALASARNALAGSDAAIATEVRAGHPTDEILKAAEEYRPDLIAMGSRGLGAVARFFIGSVAERIARHAACPVLIARPLKGELDRVLIGVDGSQASAGVAEWVLKCPFPAAVRFDLVTVTTPGESAVKTSPALLTPGLVAEMKALIQQERADAEKRLDDLAGRFTAAGRKVATALSTDEPAQGLLNATDQLESDLVVVGSQGHTPMDRFLIGSVSERVLRHAQCSVLVVKSA